MSTQLDLAYDNVENSLKRIQATIERIMRLLIDAQPAPAESTGTVQK